MISSAQYRIDVLICGADSGLYHKFWEGKRWSPGHTSFDKISAGTWVGQPVCITREPESIDAFAVNTDGKLYHIAFKNASWQEPKSLGGQWAGPPSAVNQGKDRIDIFMVGLASALYHKKFDGSKFTPDGENWTSIGGQFKGGVSLAVGGYYGLNVLTLGQNSTLYRKRWHNDQPASDQWDVLVSSLDMRIQLTLALTIIREIPFFQVNQGFLSFRFPLFFL